MKNTMPVRISNLESQKLLHIYKIHYFNVTANAAFDQCGCHSDGTGAPSVASTVESISRTLIFMVTSFTSQ